MFYSNSTLNLGIPPVLVFQLEVYYKVNGHLSAQQKGTTARLYLNKASLSIVMENHIPIRPDRSLQLGRQTSKWSLWYVVFDENNSRFFVG